MGWGERKVGIEGQREGGERKRGRGRDTEGGLHGGVRGRKICSEQLT